MIELKEYTKEFPNKVLFSNINVEFKEGMIGFVGESGCGKSTLLKNISLTDLDYKGKIITDGFDYKEVKKKEELRAQLFSYIFSEAYLLDYLSLEENATLACKINHHAIDESMLANLIHYMKLDYLVDRDVSTLSSGEKQRVAILRALVYQRPYLIADEPTAHLDPKTAREIIELLKDISSSMKKTILIAIHDYNNLDLFDKVYKVEERKLVPYE